jgi:asparagine synthase (glutamine-hydrolysing)
MIPELAEAFTRAVEQNLEDRIGVSFSGGLDSTMIAHAAKKHAEVLLFSVGMPGSEDLVFAERVSKELGLALYKHEFVENEILDLYGQCHDIVPAEFLKLELLIPVYKVAEMAKAKQASALLFGSGSEELFAGYDRYFTYADEGKDVDKILREEFATLKDREIGMIKKICWKFGIEARFPFYDRKLAELVFSIPVEERMADRELKKCVLREAGKLLGAPETALQRKKRAMQYGSGVHKVLLRHSEEINKKYPAKLG